MKNMIKKGKSAAVIITALTMLAGCGNSGNTSVAPASPSEQISETTVQNQELSAPAADVPVTTIIIGTGGKPKPWLWVDEDGRVSGYDAEVIYAIDELLPQYEFQFEVTEFASLFTGVDSGRYTMAVNNFNWREDRAEKYLFGEEYVCYEKEVIYVRKGFDRIHSLEDIGGFKTFTDGSGLMTQLFLEDYNEQHPDNPVELVYSDADTLKVFQDIQAGVADFGFLGLPQLENYLEIYPSFYDDFDIIDLTDEEVEQICSPYTYFIYAKTPEGEELKEAVDGALKELKENGTITELSLQYIGYDVTGR